MLQVTDDTGTEEEWAKLLVDRNDPNYDPEDEVLSAQDDRDIEISGSNIDDYREGEEGWYE